MNFEVPDEILCVSITVVWNASYPAMKMANITIPTDKLIDGAEFKIPPDVEDT